MYCNIKVDASAFTGTYLRHGAKVFTCFHRKCVWVALDYGLKKGICSVLAALYGRFLLSYLGEEANTERRDQMYSNRTSPSTLSKDRYL